MLSAMADAASGDVRPRQDGVLLPSLPPPSPPCWRRPSSGDSTRPHSAPTHIWKSVAAAMPSSRVVSGAAARVAATLLKSMQGMSSWKDTCTLSVQGEGVLQRYARGIIDMSSAPPGQHGHLSLPTWLMTVAVELGMRPVRSSQPTAPQISRSLPEAEMVAASTPGSIAAVTEAARELPATAGAAATLAAAPNSCSGSACARNGDALR